VSCVDSADQDCQPKWVSGSKPFGGELATIPALIICQAGLEGIVIASLTLLDRLVVAIHRAGAGPITIVGLQDVPNLRRARALGISVQMAAETPDRNEVTLVASAGLLVKAGDVRRLLQSGSRLSDSSGRLLPIGVVPPGNGSWQAALELSPVVMAEDVACLVTDKPSAVRAEKALWNSLTSASDGFVDRIFNRRCGRPLSKLLVHTEVSPNTVTVASMVIGLASAWFFAVGRPGDVLLGAVLFQISAIVDCVDGDLARVLFKESRSGKWLDLVADQVVHIGVFAGIAIGLARTNQSPDALWLGLSAVVGAALSFAVVVRGMRQAETSRTGLLQKLIDAATNRDFSVVVFVLACLQSLEWFLWLAAAGTHLFWMTALALQMGKRPGAPA
jgi:phosphatidylglycerophosphate synthase